MITRSSSVATGFPLLGLRCRGAQISKVTNGEIQVGTHAVKSPFRFTRCAVSVPYTPSSSSSSKSNGQSEDRRILSGKSVGGVPAEGGSLSTNAPAKQRPLGSNRASGNRGNRIGKDGLESGLEEIFRSGRLKEPEQFFDACQERQDLASPRELALLLELVWPAALRKQTASQENDGSTQANETKARKALFNTKGFLRVMKDIMWKINRFGPQDLPRLIVAMHTMRWSDREFLRIAQSQVIKHLPAIDLEDVPGTIVSYVEAQCGTQMFYDEFSRRCSQAAWEFKPEALATVVSAFSRSPHKPKALLIDVGPAVADALPTLECQQVARIAEAYARWPRDVPFSLAAGLVELICAEGSKLAELMTASQWVVLLRAMVLWKGRARGSEPSVSADDVNAALHFASEPLLRGRGELTPEQAATAFWAYSKLSTVPETLFKSLYEDIVQGVDRLDEPALAASLLISARAAIGQIRAQKPAATENDVGTTEEKQAHDTSFSDALCDLRLLDAAEEKVSSNILAFDIRDTTSVVLAYSMSHAGSPALFAVLHKACIDRCRQFTMEQIASVGWSFATIRLSASFFKEAQFDVLERVNQVTVPGACDILWAYSAARHRDPYFFKALLSILVPSRVAGDRRCAMLCPALLDIRTHLPEMDPEGLDRYLSYAREEFHKTQVSSLPSYSALNSLSATVGEIGLAHTMAADIDGYVVDVLVEGDQEDGRPPIAVLYHSAPRTLHRRTGEPLGQALMRQRHLKSCGFAVVNLWDESWDKMGAAQRILTLEQRIHVFWPDRECTER